MTGGQLVAVGEQDRRADRAGAEHGGGHAPCQSSLSTSTTAVGPVGVAGGGEDGAGHARDVGGGVAAAHAVVFLVAVEGKPSFAAAVLVVRTSVPSWGGRVVARRPASSRRGAAAASSGESRRDALTRTGADRSDHGRAQTANLDVG